MNTNKTGTGCIGAALPYVIGYFCIFLGILDAGGPFGAAMSVIGTAILVIRSCITAKRIAEQLQQSLKEELTEQFFQTASQDVITRRLLAEELQRQQSAPETRYSKAVLKRKTIYGSVGLVLLAILLHNCYYIESFIPVSCMALLVFAWLWNRATPVQLLCSAASRHPKVAFTQLVRDSLGDEGTRTQSRLRSTLGLGLLALILVSFVMGTSQIRLDYAPTEGGLMLTSYRPALTNMAEVTVPETVDGQPVVAIGDDVFADCPNLKKVNLPDSLRTMGVRVFKNCTSLTEVTLPGKLQTLGGEAFMNCEELTAIRIPEGVTELRGNTFEGCVKLADVQLHEGITAIHAYCFRGCEALKSIELPSRITEIRTYTFEGCHALESVYIPAGVTRIASHAFHNCTSLSYVYLPDTLEEIGSSAFRNCKALLSVNMPKGVNREDNAFKESPTEFKQKRFSDDQWNTILEEMNGKPVTTPLYYMYNLDKGVDAICRYGTQGYVVLTDSPEYSAFLSENRALQPLETTAELIAWLEKAREAEVTTVNLRRYSHIATEAAGSMNFITVEYEMDALLEQLKAENEHG